MRFDYSNLHELKHRLDDSIKRFNILAENFDALEDNILNQDLGVKEFMSDIKEESLFVESMISNLHVLCTQSEKIRKNLKSEFKLILKKEQFDRLQKRVDLLDFENMMPRHEFERLIFSRS